MKPKPKMTEDNAAAMLEAFGRQVNDGRKFTLEELQPILAYAAKLIARQHDEIRLLAVEIEALKIRLNPPPVPIPAPPPIPRATASPKR